jgi:hypothetical protein
VACGVERVCERPAGLSIDLEREPLLVYGIVTFCIVFLTLQALFLIRLFKSQERTRAEVENAIGQTACLIFVMVLLLSLVLVPAVTSEHPNKGGPPADEAVPGRPHE